MNAKLSFCLSIILSFTLAVPAEEKDPFAPRDPNAPPEPIPRLAIVYEILEVDRAAWLQWAADPQSSLRGPELHAAARKWQEAGKARVEHLSVAVHGMGTRAVFQSAREVLVPEGPGPGIELPPEWQKLKDQSPPVPQIFYRFSAQRAGFRWEGAADAFIEDKGARYPFDFQAEYTAVTREDTLGTGLAESKIPVLANVTSRMVNETSGGEFLLMNVASPFPGRNADAVWLCFARVDRGNVMPFARPPTRGKVPFMPSSASVLVEWIEMGQPEWAAIASQPDESLRAAVGKLIAEGKAAVTETAVLASRFDTRQKVMAAEEFTYIDKYESPRYTADGQLYQHELGADFETRYLGEIVEYETVSYPDGTVGANLGIFQTSLKGMRPWGAPELKQSYPDFRDARIETFLCLPLGQSRLVSAQASIKPANPAWEKPRMLVFARADGGGDVSQVMEVEEPPHFPTGRFTLRVLETTQQRLSAWLTQEGNSAAGGGLFAQISPEAKLVETATLTAQLNGTQGVMRANDELSYPSEYDACRWITPQKLSPVVPAAFETRNLGLSLRLRGNWVHPENILNCALEADYVTLAGLRAYHKGEAMSHFPDFDSQHLQTALPLRPDKEPVWLGTTRPPGREPGSDAIWAWFLSAEILP